MLHLSRIDNALMTPENVSYLVEKRVYQLFGRMLMHIAKLQPDEPHDLIPSLVEMLEKDRALGRSSNLDHMRDDSALGIQNAAMGFLGNVPSSGPTRMIALPTATEILQVHYRCQGILAVLADTPGKVKYRSQMLSDVYQEFADLCLPVVETIVREMQLPPEQRTVTLLGDSDTYLHAGLVIRRATTSSSTSVLGSRENASKILSHERKAMGCVLSANIVDLHMPLSVKVTYVGQPFWVHTRLPLSPENLVYGNIDTAKTIVKASCLMNGMMKRLGESLNLKGHRSGQAPKRVQVIYGPHDIQGYHCPADGKYYLMSLSRLFPPTQPEPHIKNSYLVHLLRPEACQLSLKPLNSDTFSPFNADPEDEADVIAATEEIFSRLLPTVASTLMMEGTLSSEQLTEIAHQHGLNCRYFGRLLPMVTSSPVITTVLCTELVARTFRRLLEDEWYIAAQQVGVTVPDYQDIAIRMFHVLLDGDMHFWKHTLQPRLVAKFGAFNALSLISLDSVDRAMLFQRCCRLTGCRFGGMEAFNFHDLIIPEDLRPSNALQSCEIVPLPKLPQVRPLSTPAELYMNGHAEESAKLYEAAVQRVEATLGPASPSLVPLLNGLAAACRAQGARRYAEAETCLRRVIVIRDLDEGVQDTCYMDALRSLADFYIYHKRHTQATQALETCIGLFKSTFGEDHLGLSRYCNTLGNLLYWKGEPEQTLQCYQEALAIREANYGPKHPEVADSLLHLGLFYSRVDGRRAEASSYLEKALAILRANYGVCPHPDVAKGIYHLAVVSYESGQVRQAEMLFQECLPVLQQSFGAHDALVGATWTYLKRIKGLSSVPAAVGEPGVYPQKGAAHKPFEPEREAELQELVAEMKFEEAIPLYEEYASAQKEEYGDDSGEYAAALMQCGHNYLALQRCEEALNTFRAAEAAMKLAYSPTHVYVADALYAKSEAQADAGNYEEAVVEYEQALQIWGVQYADNTTSLCEVWTRLARLHLRFHKVAKSLKVWRKVLEMCSRGLGPDHPKTKEITEAMQEVYHAVHRLEQQQLQEPQAAEVSAAGAPEEAPAPGWAAVEAVKG